MPSLKNNIVIKQFRVLLRAALVLKENFDKSQPIEVLRPLQEIYQREFEELKKNCPKDIYKVGDLVRHSGWLAKWIRENKPDNCIGDISEICYTDIFLAEEMYLHHLTDTNDASEKYYDWQNIHPIILKIAQPRFESLHFADAVEASFKEINDLIKKKYKALTKKEIDGNDLMRKAFTSSPNNEFTPLFNLADNSTNSGKNIQQGYMDIFAGAMQGIRNPKAHENMNINPDEAWEMIVLASHLMRMWKKFN